MKLKETLLLNFSMTKHLLKASPRFFIMNFLNTVIDVISYLFQMLFYQKVIDLIIYSSPALQDAAKFFLFYYLMCTLFFSVNYLITTYFNEKEKVKINLYYKQMIYTETVKNKMEYYHSSDYGDRLYNAVYHDGSYLFSFANRLFSLLNAILSLCATSYIFIELHPLLAAGSLCVAIKNIIIVKKKNIVEYQKYIDDLPLERCKTYINNIFYLKTYARELRLYSIGDYFRKKFTQIYDLVWQINKKYYRKLSVIAIMDRIFDVLAYIFNIVVLVALLRKNQITVGEFSLILSRFVALAQYIENVIMFIPALENDSQYIKDISSVIEREKHEFARINSHSTEIEDCIRFVNVSFAYHEKNYVINNLNLELPFGKKIALVGENGSGKSTFVKLLLGLYQPTAGEITYYFKNIQGSCKCLFSSMFQDFQVYALSLAENIYPLYEAGDTAKIMEAVQFSELEQKISTLSNGIDSQVTKEFTNEGIYFSGGEKQKLALARAYANNKPILILDEPSSNLDPVAEQKILEKINHLISNRTVILVTHNLVNTRTADMVYYFEKGQIVECGTPEELVRANGRYWAMLNLQLKQLGRICSFDCMVQADASSVK